MRKIIYFILFVLSFQISQAQLKKLTLEDAVLKSGRDYLPSRLTYLQWHSDGKRFTWVVKAGNREALVAKTIQKKPVDTLIWLDSLVSIGQQNGVKDWPKRFPIYQWKDGNIIVMNGTTWYLIDLGKKQCKPILAMPDQAEHPDIHPSLTQIAFTKGADLYISEGPGKKETLVASSSEEGIVYGQQVHREEFGITKGTFWSPNGQALAFYRKDERQVTTYPIVTLKDQPSKPLFTRYPMAGEKSHTVRVGVFFTSNGKIVYLNTGAEDDHYLTNIAWSEDGKYIYIAELNRGQNHLKFNRYVAEDGRFDKTLFEETHEKYVEPENAMIWIPGKNQFLWQSERDGFNHLYLYDTDGKLIRQVTSGEWVVTAVHGVSPDGKNVYFTSTQSEFKITPGLDPDMNPTEHSLQIGAINRMVQCTEIAGINPTIITLNPAITGTHSPVFNQDYSAFLDNFTSVSVPRNIYVVSTKKMGIYEMIHEAKNPWSEFAMPTVHLYSIANKDGIRLHCREIRPSNFDPAKKYPLLVYLYNGPHAQLVNNVWVTPSEAWMHYMAEQGFIVFTMDGRGSLNRGRDFENATFRQLGNKEMEDQLLGLSLLKKYHYIDSSRTAVYGWSFGGFMSTSLMFRFPGSFKVGVAGGPVIDWSMYEVMYTERYMDTPKENPDGYKEANLLNYTKNLEGKMLMIHCSADSTVLWEHSMKFLKKCIENGTQLDYFVYPEHEHNVRGPERVHLLRKVTDYIITNLKNN